MQHHFETLISLVSGSAQSDFSDTERWQDIESAAERNFLAGLLYRVAPDRASLLEKFWASQRLFNAMAFDFLEKLEKTARDEGILVTRLKGASLVPRLYPDLGSRHLCDIDILIDPAQLDRVAQILRHNGFEIVPIIQWQASFYRTTWMRVDSVGIAMSIDVHTQIYWDQRRDFQPQITSHDGFNRLNEKYEFLHLIINWFEQDTCVSFNKMIDIFFYARELNSRSEWNWDSWWRFAEQAGHRRSANLMRFMLSKYFALEIPGPSHMDMQEWLARRILSPQFLMNPQNYRVRYFTLKHLTKDFGKALKYDWQWGLARLKRRFLG